MPINPEKFYSFSEVAAIFGYHRSTASRKLRKLGVAVIEDFGDPRVHGADLLVLIEKLKAASLERAAAKWTSEAPARRPAGRPRKRPVGGAS